MTTTAHPVYLKAKAHEWIGPADLAKLIRTALAKAWPTVKFAVTSKSYSGGSSVTIRWVDGPSSTAVNKVTGQFQTRNFDGMIDMAHDRDLWLAPDGSVSVAHDPGTARSRGTHSEVIGSAHSPDAVLVTKLSGCYMQTSQTLSADRVNTGIELVKAFRYAELEAFDWGTVKAVAKIGWNGKPYGELVCPILQMASGRWLSDVIFNAARSAGDLVPAI